MAEEPLDTLYRRPGFMIRRAHQIAVSLFLEETGALGITNRQFGIMLVLKAQPGIDQITVAKLLGLDRSTTGMVLTKLEQAGLVGRVVGANDRRKRSLKLTPAGERMLKRLARTGAAGAGARAVGVLAARAQDIPRSAGQVRARRSTTSTRVPQVVQREAATLRIASRKRRPRLILKTCW